MSKPPRESLLNRNAEKALMQKIAAGDEQAFTEFDSKYRTLIFSTANKIMQSPHDCEDITNEVLITIWRKASQFDSVRGSLVTWICTTTRNRSIDKLRSMGRKIKLHEDFGASNEITNCGIQCGFNDILRSDTQYLLERHLQQLPESQQAVIRLVYLEGLTQKQASEALDVPIGTVKGRIRKGLNSMKEQLELST